MNKDTGELKEMQKLTEEEIKSGKWIPVPEREYANVRSMNRKQRRAWAKQQKSRK